MPSSACKKSEELQTSSSSHPLVLRLGLGYPRVTDFPGSKVRECDAAAARLKEQGMERLTLDLRQNPGGRLDAAVGVSDHFLDKGQMIVYTKGRTPDSMQDYNAPGKHTHYFMPLGVLVNRGSASASEIVT